MSDVAMSSKTMLASAPAAYQPVFSPQPVYDTLYFDEGAQVPKAKAIKPGADTSAIDPFTQGVEITKMARYDAGMVKIWSGEPGHVLKPNRFGEDRNFFPDPGFTEIDLFDPVRYLKAQEVISPLYYIIITFPIITGDNDQLENFNFNGVIEPLTLRANLAFFTTDIPFEAHSAKGALMAGNIDQSLASDRVLTVDRYDPMHSTISYIDMVDMLENHPMIGFFIFDKATIAPFSDASHARNVQPPSSEDAGLLVALGAMKSSTDSYLGTNERSATCGWVYDNTAATGTDSLAFGGMTY